MDAHVVSVVHWLAGGLVSVFLLPPQGGEVMREGMVGVRVVAGRSGGLVRMMRVVRVMIKRGPVFALRVSLLASGPVLLPGDR